MRGQVVRLYQPVELFTEECCSCGVTFGLPVAFKDERVKDHRAFYCPNGHNQWYTSETEAEKNLRLLRAEEARHRLTLARENQERLAKEKAERKLKRVDKGVCPKCNRTFANLARHMSCKHGVGVDGKIGNPKLP